MNSISDEKELEKIMDTPISKLTTYQCYIFITFLFRLFFPAIVTLLEVISHIICLMGLLGTIMIGAVGMIMNDPGYGYLVVTSLYVMIPALVTCLVCKSYPYTNETNRT